MNRMTGYALVVTWCLLAALAQAQAPAVTKVTLTELDCMGCAKKVGKKLCAVPGVAEARVDLKARALYAIHKSGQTPSPRALWEAVEQADHSVERLDTPTGSYTSKPD
jgi:copper chaperone CopZ